MSRIPRMLAAVAVLAACSDSSTDVPTDTVASVTVSPTTASIAVGATQAFTAVTRNADGDVLTGHAVTWTSATTAIASISSSGMATGLTAGGPVTITATSEGKSGSATLTVTAPVVVSIDLAPPTSTLAVGETVQLAATAKDASGTTIPNDVFIWTSSDQTFATVSSTGLVTAVAAGGPVMISAKLGAVNGTAEVTVTPPIAASVDLTPATNTLAAGETVQLTAIAKDGSGTDIPDAEFTWTSSDETIATVSETGLVTAVVAGGPVTISAETGDVSADAEVTVTAPVVASIGVTPPTNTLAVGMTVQLAAEAKDGSGTVIPGAVITWTSSDETIATVSVTGLVTAVAAGGPVTITAENGAVSGDAAVTVN